MPATGMDSPPGTSMKRGNMPPEGWQGRMFLESGQLVYAGPAGSTALHAHHAFQLLVALKDTAEIQGADGVQVRTHVAVIPPDASHAFVTPVPAVVLLYIDPDGLAGRLLRRKGGSARDAAQWVVAGQPLLAAAPDSLPRTWEEARRVATALLSTLVGPSQRPQVLHPAVLRAVRYLNDSLERDVRLGAVASHAGISPSRLSHLFASQLGIPLRPYVLWLRLQRAAAALREGLTLTEAAHRAGFADGAHLTRVFRRMFGIRPTEVMGWAEWVVPEPLGASR
ncbi:helix-turn-helix transcriptional regulator [Pyxidicoccus sp. MSG2]|uniref:helix-turn-helix transcriptional regulator n=1 Tax=Pyxidicoccus sp. MSG2 TaxID=2996790 RepID=UPI0022720B68|nr:AraC family transcriptional regulator [Pyxidicoccus sp. MSG2]MCY1024035.1 AraC family transcriptional regulator [Pyxidicoccus sp. MSG2]